jgi:hypothetical protein
MSLVFGIDNHQLTGIKIATVAAYAESQCGPVILVMHQYAVHQANRTIHTRAFNSNTLVVSLKIDLKKLEDYSASRHPMDMCFLSTSFKDSHI